MSILASNASGTNSGATPSAQNDSVAIRPQRSIGGIFFDVVIEEAHEDTLQITEHPVEQGAAISDHAYKSPTKVTIRAGVSDSGNQANTGGEGASRELYNKLLELQAAREPMDIITGKRKYTNMLISSLNEITDASTENSLIVVAECTEVIIVKTQTTTVPPRAKHQNPGSTGSTADKGQAQTKPDQSAMAAGMGGGKVYNKNSPHYKPSQQ